MGCGNTQIMTESKYSNGNVLEFKPNLIREQSMAEE